MGRFLRTTCLSTLLLLSAPPAWPRQDPGLDWRQVATEHFLVIYPAEAAQAAARTAVAAERIYPKVRDLLGFAPSGRTPLVLNSRLDLANASAEAIPRRIILNLTSPSGPGFGPGDPELIEFLLVHEFAHLCHGMRAEGFTRALTDVFGEVAMINFIAPQWWVEGVAVDAETELTPGGRGRNAYHRLKLAANLFAFPPDRVYVAGYDLIQRLRVEFGDARLLDRLSARQSAAPFGGLGDVWTHVAGRSPEAVWKDLWRERTREDRDRYGEDRPCLPDDWRLTNDPEAFFGEPRWLADGRIAAYRRSLGAGNGLLALDATTGHAEVLGDPDLPIQRYAYTPATGTFTYARLLPNPVISSNLTADLFEWRPGSGERRLTWNARAWSPDVAPDGRVVYVVNEFGPLGLRILDPANGSVRAVPAPAGAVFAAPRWSPDGKQLAAEVQLGGSRQVCIVDPESGSLTALSGWDYAGNYTPAWSPDGRFIFFSSDRTGAHQIYAYEVATGVRFRVTDAWLGAFDPEPSPDGKRIALAEYRPGNTQQIVVAPLDPQDWQRVKGDPPRPQPTPDPGYALPRAEGIGYSAWPHLVPTFWVPMLGLDRDGVLFGASLGREDPLGLHSWWGTLLVQPLTGQVYGDLAYTNQDTPLALTGRVFRQDHTRWGRPGDPQDERTYWARFQGAALAAELPLVLGLAADRYISLELKAEAMFAGLRPADPAVYPGAEYAGISGEAVWQSLSQRPLDLFPCAGLSLTLGGQAALPGRVYDGRRAQAGVQLHVPGLGEHQALVLGARGADSAGVFPESPLDAAPRGYRGGRFTAARQLTVSAAYRVPLAYFDRGPGLWPVFFYGLWAEVFTDWGTGWEGVLSPRDWARTSVGSVGVLGHLQMQWFWYLPVTAELGVTYRTEKRDAVLLGTLNLGF
jgi:hypothetical protein